MDERGPVYERYRPSMLARLDDGARRVIGVADEEALRLHHDWLDTEHLMLAFVLEGHLREAMPLDLDALRADVMRIVGAGAPEAPPHRRLTPRTRSIVVRAVERLGDAHDAAVTARRLLLELLQDEDGVGVQVLEHGGVD